MSDDEGGERVAEKRKRKRKHGGGADKVTEKASKQEVVESIPSGVEAYNNDRTLYIEVLLIHLITYLLTHSLTLSLINSGASFYCD